MKISIPRLLLLSIVTGLFGCSNAGDGLRSNPVPDSYGSTQRYQGDSSVINDRLDVADRHQDFPPSQVERPNQSVRDSIPPEIPYYTRKTNPDRIPPTAEGRPYLTNLRTHIPRADESESARSSWAAEEIVKNINRHYRYHGGANALFGNKEDSGRPFLDEMARRGLHNDIEIILWIGYPHVPYPERLNLTKQIVFAVENRKDLRLVATAKYCREILDDIQRFCN